MRNVLIVPALALGLVLAGCAASPKQIGEMTFGPAPAISVENIAPAFRYYLADPLSAQIEPVGRPYKAYMLKPLIRGGGVDWSGWAIDANVNAKNRLGGYTGFRLFRVMLDPTGLGVGVYEAQPVEALFHRAAD